MELRTINNVEERSDGNESNIVIRKKLNLAKVT